VVGQRPDAQRAQTAQLPAQALGCQQDRLALIDADRGGLAVVARQVAVLPFRGDPAVGHRFHFNADDDDPYDPTEFIDDDDDEF
jgi:hypothetical protein